MPFSASNPNRNRNYVILIVALTFAFAVVMGGYITLSIAGRDTDAYLRFLTLLVVTLVPSSLAAFRANAAATKTHEVATQLGQVASQTDATAEALNGGFEDRVRSIVRSENERQTEQNEKG